jgi:hypothetical protein
LCRPLAAQERGPAAMQGKRFSVFVSVRHSSWSQGQEAEGGRAGGSGFSSEEPPAGWHHQRWWCTVCVPCRDAMGGPRGRQEQSGKSAERCGGHTPGSKATSVVRGIRWRRRPAFQLRLGCAVRVSWSSGFGPGERWQQQGESLKSSSSPREHRAEVSWQRGVEATDSWQGHPPEGGAPGSTGLRFGEGTRARVANHREGQGLR